MTKQFGSSRDASAAAGWLLVLGILGIGFVIGLAVGLVVS